MFGNKNGLARFLSLGWRKFSIANGSLKPRLSRHCASSGEIFNCDASCPASSGCGGASVQRNFILCVEPLNRESLNRRRFNGLTNHESTFLRARTGKVEFQTFADVEF